MTATLVLIEHDGRSVKPSSLNALTAAQKLGGDCSLLTLGSHLGDISASLAPYGAVAVLTADDPACEHPLADRYAAVIAQAVRVIGADAIVGCSSTFTKDILPRVASLIDAPMLSDVTEINDCDGQRQFVRPIHAGSAFATVTVSSEKLVMTCRAASFDPPVKIAELSPIETIEIETQSLPCGTEFVSREAHQSDRPDLTEARVVVSGGRPLKDKATFEALIGGLADALGGAVGATRAAVDAGMAPNDWQIGQTGKVITPDLYVAAGVSGSVQHSAGIQDSRIIVAINKDPEAPIFELASYGLVGDLYQVLPELIDALQRK